MGPFRTKINSSTALATATTRASDLQKNSREQDCDDTTKISDVYLLLQNKALDRIQLETPRGQLSCHSSSRIYT